LGELQKEILVIDSIFRITKKSQPYLQKSLTNEFSRELSHSFDFDFFANHCGNFAFGYKFQK
jgi:hypothetical protein